jgi:hypothetical protein
MTGSLRFEHASEDQRIESPIGQRCGSGADFRSVGLHGDRMDGKGQDRLHADADRMRWMAED